MQVCNAFNTRADAVAAAVVKSGRTVAIDTQPAEGRKPDRGSFAIVADGKTIVELRSMPRPFVAMKALDMDAVTQQVLAALKA